MDKTHKLLIFTRIIKKNKKLIFLILFAIFIRIILLSFNYEKKETNNIGKYFNLDADIKDKVIFFQKINKYLNICREEKLLNSISHKNIKSPKITAIIPVYNAFKTIKSAIRSIQNQNMKEIEIILVDDVSTDNSTKIINELILEDKRIKLIKNKKNRGTLYSRSIGALNAKGKYIMALDNDDLFLYGIFNKCFEEAEQNNIDIIEFSGLQICSNCSADINNIYIPYFLRFKKNELIVKQPILSSFEYIRTNISFEFIDVFVWGKLIKTKIYQKAISLIGNDIYKHNICLTEDKIFVFGLFKIANSFKFIDIYGIIYVENQDSICHTWSITKQKRIIHDFFMLSIIFFKLSKHSKEVQIVVDEVKKHFNDFSSKLDENHKKLLINLYKDLISNENIIKSEKELLDKLMIENKANLNITN